MARRLGVQQAFAANLVHLGKSMATHARHISQAAIKARWLPAMLGWLSLATAACSTPAAPGAPAALSSADPPATPVAMSASPSATASASPSQRDLSPPLEPPTPAATQPQPKAATQPTTLSAQHQRQLQVFGPTLLNPSSDIDSETRRNAAHELILMNVPEACAILEEALRSQRPALMLAVAGAMQSASSGDSPLLLDAAVLALRSAPPAVVESLAWGLARSGEPALTRVVAAATDRSSPTAARLGPINALSAFESKAAAGALMRVLEGPNEPADILNAACDSLERLSGLSWGRDPQQWQRWWSQATDLAPERWAAFIAESQGQRIATLQQELQDQREANERVSRELFSVYRDLYPALPIDEQLRRLPRLLQDPLAAVREFAISRVSLLLRDSVRIPVEVQSKVAERLNDESPALRAQAARLLDELNYETTGELLAARLAAEQSSPAAAAMLEVLARRAAPAAAQPALRLLDDPELGDQAADVIWNLQEHGKLADEQRETIRVALRKAAEERLSPAIARLLAWIGDQLDAESLIEILDGDDPSLQAAVAEGFLRRGLRHPLVERAADAVIYPFALRALADGPAELSAFHTLVEIAPPESGRKLWTDAATKLASRLPGPQLLAADDILLAAASIETSLRQAVLTRAAALPPEELASDEHAKVIARLAPLLIQLGNAPGAYDLLDGSNCEAPEFKTACFQAAALTGHYGKAAVLQREPTAWINLLSQTTPRDTVTALHLRDEIARRFDRHMTPADQAAFDRINQALHEEASASAGPHESSPREPR